MIDLNLFDKEIEHELCEAVTAFNTSFKADPQKVMDKSYYQLWKDNKEIDLLVWRKFYTDPRVVEFYDKEFELGLKAKKNILLRMVGENNSTATVQGLMNIIKRDEDADFDIDDNKIFIYSFIPLNQQEAHAENVRILENIPKEIGDALTVIDGNQETE